MKNKKKMWLFGILVLVIIGVIGISYALWQIVIQQTDENIITSGCFQFEFQDQNPIHLEKGYPISDEEGVILVPYEFTIKNICDTYASYQINLEVLNTTTLRNLNYMKVMLDEKISLFSENLETEPILDNATTAYELKVGYLREKEEKRYTLRLWMSEDTPAETEFMNQLLETKITIKATYLENIENEIEVNAVSQTENYSDSEIFLIQAVSKWFDLVAMSEDLEHWEAFETPGKEVTFEKAWTTNGSHKLYVQDEVGNVKEVVMEATKIDDQKPIAGFEVTRNGNKVIIDASSSKDNESGVKTYYYSMDGVNYYFTHENHYEFIESYEYGTATTMLMNYEKTQIQTVYVWVSDQFGNMSEVQKKQVVSDFAYDETVDNNLRYIGANPDNYVLFNNELWRIIGVMNHVDDGSGKKETRIKLRRSEEIGSYARASSNSAVNKGFGTNEWSVSRLMKLLNPGFSTETYSNSLYWDALSGKCYTESNEEVSDCDFTSIGLSETAKNFIGDAVWYTGSNGTNDPHTINVKDFYNLERSNNSGKICNGGSECNDSMVRTVTWTGKVGLISPSDSGFAINGLNADSRKTCLNINLFNAWMNSSYLECYQNNWLLAQDNQWSIMPVASSTSASLAYAIGPRGSPWANPASQPYITYPTIYLKSNVQILSGTGEQSSPFVVSLE